MRVEEIIDQVVLSLALRQVPAPDRRILLQLCRHELNSLGAKSPFDWLQVQHESLVRTIADQEAYDLPIDFPSNFACKDRDYAVRLDDGTTSTVLDWETPVVFLSRDRLTVSSNRPTHYTITTARGGTRKLLLHPKPDGVYTVGGLYQPTDWDLRAESQLPPCPQPDVLVYGILKRVDIAGFREWSAAYQVALGDLMIAEAQNRQVQLQPAMDSTDYFNSYEGISR